MSEIRILKMTKKRVLVYNRYLFKINRCVENDSYWRCKNSSCAATLKLTLGVLSNANNEHNHEPPESELLKLETKSLLKMALSEDQ